MNTMLPDFKKLYAPYAVDGASLNKTLNWLKASTGVTDDIVQSVLMDVMLMLADGESFALDGCQCGCDLKKSHSALNHFMRDLALAKNKVAVDAYWDRVQVDTYKRLQKQIRPGFFTWSNSPVIQLISRMKGNNNGS